MRWLFSLLLPAALGAQTRVEIDGNGTMPLATQQTVRAVRQYNKQGRLVTDPNIYWYSLNTATVAVVSYRSTSALVEARQLGVGRIVARWRYQGVYAYDTLAIAVTGAPQGPYTLTFANLPNDTLTLMPGKDAIVVAQTFSGTVRLTNPKVQWLPDAPTMVDVLNRAADDDSAKVHAYRVGTQKIAANWAAPDGSILSRNLFVRVPPDTFRLQGVAADTLSWKSDRFYEYAVTKNSQAVTSIDPANVVISIGPFGIISGPHLVTTVGNKIRFMAIGDGPGIGQITVTYNGGRATTSVAVLRSVAAVGVVGPNGETGVIPLRLCSDTVQTVPCSVQTYAVLYDIEGKVIEVSPTPPPGFPIVPVGELRFLQPQAERQRIARR